MDNCDLKVYSIWVKGLHETKFQQQIICVAICAEQAIKMAASVAEEYGFSNVEIDQFTCIGAVDMFPWSNEQEIEVTKCQQ